MVSAEWPRWYASQQASVFVWGNSTHNADLIPCNGLDCATIPAAVRLLGVRDIRISNCSFRHLGGAGLSLSGGTQNATVQGCELMDISASGLTIGTAMSGYDALALEQRDAQIAVLDNRIEHVAQEFFGAVGILTTFTHNLTILHNEIAHVSYSCVSIGWGWWSRAPLALSSHTEVGWNECWDHMRVLGDGGGIYTDSPMPGTTVHHNYVHDEANRTVNPDRVANDGGAFYHDGGSTGIVNSYNVVRNPYNPHARLLWASSIPAWQVHNVTVEFLYSDCLDQHCFGSFCASDCNVTNLTAVSAKSIADWPAEARSVILNAGVRSGWRSYSADLDAVDEYLR